MAEDSNTERNKDRLYIVKPAHSPSFSSSYLIDSDREFTAESMLTRRSLFKCSWGPGAYTLNHTGTHTFNLPYLWYSAHFERLPLDICPVET